MKDRSFETEDGRMKRSFPGVRRLDAALERWEKTGVGSFEKGEFYFRLIVNLIHRKG